MIDDVSMAGFILAVFVFGITVGKFVEKIKRFIIGKEDEMFCLESKTVRKPSVLSKRCMEHAPRAQHLLGLPSSESVFLIRQNHSRLFLYVSYFIVVCILHKIIANGCKNDILKKSRKRRGATIKKALPANLSQHGRAFIFCTKQIISKSQNLIRNYFCGAGRYGLTGF